MNMRIAGIVNDSIVDGPGLRLAIFAQGCPHHCPGCHNPESHDFAGGSDMDTEKIIARMDANPLLDGITLTGGEPFEQPEACRILADAAHARGLNVWAYSGYTFEQLCAVPKSVACWKPATCWWTGRFCWRSARSICAFAARKTSAFSKSPNCWPAASDRSPFFAKEAKRREHFGNRYRFFR